MPQAVLPLCGKKFLKFEFQFSLVSAIIIYQFEQQLCGLCAKYAVTFCGLSFCGINDAVKKMPSHLIS